MVSILSVKEREDLEKELEQLEEDWSRSEEILGETMMSGVCSGYSSDDVDTSGITSIRGRISERIYEVKEKLGLNVGKTMNFFTPSYCDIKDEDVPF